MSNREEQFTKAAYDPRDARHHGAIHVPIYQNSLFAFDRHDQFDDAMKELLNHHVYSRGNNPTVQYLEQKLADMEEAESAKCFASGMAAISSAILSVVGQGDHIVCVHQAYGPTREFLSSYLSRFGVETTFIDGSSIEQWRGAARPNTKLFYLESPTTSFFELQNLRLCAELARSLGVKTIIDNTWATPCFQNPLTLGIDLVVHSITKYIGGHSDCIGGVVLGSKELIDRIGYMEYMLLGGIMTPQTAAIVSKGLRTLPLRMQRHEESGLQVAEYIGKQSFVNRVNHPGLPSHPQYELGLSQMSGFSSLFSFISTEPIAKLKEWANRLKYFKIGVSWGGFESLVTVNRVGNEEAGEQPSSVVRLYVGMESPKDLIADMDQAWKSI
ncbi:trans-sulfuration enzyme family protein [Cohnella silvisoli]|uniref:PLP-dependent aspartate aminotransferase family protein n=1 Tax=Cohnella silvisoli TaxID=2873699 RepID=A0ABV1KS44_9BACL|nr:PLP-dependent aspartate aminotransferase family protein [Cohnella silvisoli]MCD9022029.1 PLP-dependent aspartate aminotransferase family protein [Cohnella silvisoli]